jgi:hypothetical protein
MSPNETENFWFTSSDGVDFRFDTEEKIKNNLEYDLLTTDWILEKVRDSGDYAQNLYAALCNNKFQKIDLMCFLKDQNCSYSWRRSGGIIANMRQEGDYTVWYCSGMIPPDPNWLCGMEFWFGDGYVNEGVVTDEIRKDLEKLGWRVI